MHYDDGRMTVHIRLVEYLFNNQKLDVNFSIARVMISKLKEFPDITIEEIAYLAHTTPGSVTKFCKKLGYSSFKEIKTDNFYYKYSNIFQDMMHISKDRGIDSALHFFVRESQRKTLEMFEIFDHEQIKKIAARLAKIKSGAVFSGLHGFAATNLFLELSAYYGITIFEINRRAEAAMLNSVLETEDMIFIISLSGTWMEKYIEDLNITPEIAEKIILISYVNADGYQNVCSEIVSLDKMEDFFSSNYFSGTTLEMFFLLLITYLGAIIE